MYDNWSNYLEKWAIERMFGEELDDFDKHESLKEEMEKTKIEALKKIEKYMNSHNGFDDIEDEEILSYLLVEEWNKNSDWAVDLCIRIGLDTLDMVALEDDLDAFIYQYEREVGNV